MKFDLFALRPIVLVLTGLALCSCTMSSSGSRVSHADSALPPCVGTAELIRDGNFEDKPASANSGYVAGFTGTQQEFAALPIWTVQAKPPEGPAGASAFLISNELSNTSTPTAVPNTQNANYPRAYSTPCGNNCVSLSMGANTGTQLKQDIVTNLAKGQYRLQFCQSGEAGDRGFVPSAVHVTISLTNASPNAVAPLDFTFRLPAAPDNKWQLQSRTLKIGAGQEGAYSIIFSAEEQIDDPRSTGSKLMKPVIFDNVSLKRMP